jgi:hypothetical protein
MMIQIVLKDSLCAVQPCAWNYYQVSSRAEGLSWLLLVAFKLQT